MELTNNFAGHGKGQLDDRFITITGRMVENAENILPTGSDIRRLRMYNLCHASHNHISNHRRSESHCIKINYNNITIYIMQYYYKYDA